MPIYLCQLKGEKNFCGIAEGENAADALLTYDAHWQGHDDQDDAIRECDDSINTYCEQLLTEYDATELYRAQVLEYVERRLDGDRTISILLG